MKTLAQFIQQKRDNLGLSAKGLAMQTNLPLETIEDIEAGKDLFLSVTVRQNLAKILRCAPEEIKKYEEKLTASLKSHVKLKNVLDDTIIGGSIVKIGDKLIDSTLKGQLNELRKELINNSEVSI